MKMKSLAATSLFLFLSASLTYVGCSDYGPGDEEDDESYIANQRGIGLIDFVHGKRPAEAKVKRSGQSKKNGCEHATNKQLCLPPLYSKFELPFTETVNVVEIGIEILDVLRINDKVGMIQLFCMRDFLRMM